MLLWNKAFSNLSYNLLDFVIKKVTLTLKPVKLKSYVTSTTICSLNQELYMEKES